MEEVTTAEAAASLNATEGFVRVLLNLGILRARFASGVWMVATQDLEEYKSSMREQ